MCLRRALLHLFSPNLLPVISLTSARLLSSQFPLVLVFRAESNLSSPMAKTLCDNFPRINLTALTRLMNNVFSLKSYEAPDWAGPDL